MAENEAQNDGAAGTPSDEGTSPASNTDTKSGGSKSRSKSGGSKSGGGEGVGARRAQPDFSNVTVLSPNEVKANQIAESRRIAMENPLDYTENPCYIVGGEVVDPNGNPVDKSVKGAKELIAEAEKTIKELREQLRRDEETAIKNSMPPRDRMATEETTIASSARGGASTI